MASKSLGTLTLDLTLKAGGFTSGLDKAARESEKRLKQIQKNAAVIGKAIGIGFTAAATGLTFLTKQAIDNADQLGKLSQKVGISVEELSKLAYAAKLADVDLVGLQSGLVKLSKAAIESKDGLGDAASAFAALGVDVKDAQGNLKSTEQLFLETADAFATFADGPEKAAAALAIFGKSGADLIPLLNGGAAAVKAAGDELRTFGGIVTDDVAKAADQFNDNLDKLKVSSGALGTQIAAELLPDFIKLTEQFLAFVKEGEGASKIADNLADGFRTLASIGTVVGNVFQIVGDYIAAVAAIGASVMTGQFKDALNIAKQYTGDLKTDLNDVIHAFDDTGAAAKKAGDQIAKAVGTEGNKPKLGFDPEAAAKAAAATAAANKKAADEAKQHAEAIQQQVDALQEQAATLGLSSEQLALYRLEADGASESQLALARAATATIDAFTKSEAIRETTVALQQEADTVALTSRELIAYKLALQGASAEQIATAQSLQDVIDKQADLKNLTSDAVSVFDSTRTAAERYAITLEKLQELRDTLGEDGKPLIDEETFERAKDAAKEFDETFRGAFEAYADSVKNVGAALGGDLVSALDSAISQTAELAANTILWGEGGTEALKALGRSIITDVVSSLIRAGVQMAVNAALGQAFGVAALAATAAQASAAAALWSPAAIAASIATFGGASAAGLSAYLASLASGAAATTAASVAGGAGFATGGYTGDIGRSQVAGVVHGQEGVVSTGALASAAKAINDPKFWKGTGKGLQIINNAPGLTFTPGAGFLRIDQTAELAAFMESTLATGILTNKSPVGRAISQKYGVQSKAVR